MSIESFPQTQKTENKKSEKETKLSSSYNNIRNEAINILEEKIKKLQNAPGSFVEEIENLQDAINKLEDDNYILKTAETNNWESLRANGENDDVDKNLSIGLANSAIESKK